MWFAGTNDPRIRTKPAGARSVADLPWLWLSPGFPEPHMVFPYHRRGGGVVVIGTCGARREEVQQAIAGGVPDDVAWRWSGSYIVAEVAPEQVTLWAGLGAIPLYTRRTTHGILWGSSARLLASLHGAPEFDLGHITSRLAGDHTAIPYFSHVEPVAFGHKTYLNGHRIEQRPVWQPNVVVDADHAQRLRVALESAVTARLHAAKQPSTDFSGGFDSTALGLLAASQLAPQDRTIVGVTLHPNGVLQGGDLDYAREAIPSRGLRHVWMPMRREHLPYTDLDRIPATDEPSPSTVAYAHFSEQLLRLADLGSDMHMTGDGGDGLLLTPPCHITYLMRHGHPWRALGEASRWAQVRRISIWEALSNSRSAQQAHTPFPLESSSHHTILRGRMTTARTARADVELAHAFGVSLHNPYFDTNVIHTYLSTPVQDLPGPTRYKPILAEAMRDHFPPRLAGRTTKGDSSSDHHEGLRAALPTLAGDFIDGHLAESGLINREEIRQHMRRVAVGVGDLSLVQPVIETEAWMRAVRRAPVQNWEHCS